MKVSANLKTLAFAVILISVLSIAGFRNVSAQCLVPAGLNTTNIGNSSAQFNWTSVSADSFLVRYYDASAPSVYYYKTVKPGSSTNTNITGLYPATTYMWQVRTWCSGGTSGAYQNSAVSFTTTSTPVSCVTPNKTATSSISATSALVSWNPLVNADSFMVRYAVTNTTNYFWVKVPGNQKAVTIFGLTPNTTYDWWVRCICASNPSQGYSQINRFTTLSNTCTSIADAASFTSNNITHNSASVSWRAVTGALSYNVRYAIRYSGNWTTVPASGVSANLSGLVSLSWYEFQVQVVCASGAGNWSTSGIFQTTTGVVSVTRGAYLQQASPSSIFIRWRTNIPADSRVRFGTSVTNLNQTVSNATLKTEHIIQLTGLTANTKYFYSIGTANAVLQGDTGNYFFTHPPVGSTNPVRIWAIGDFGRGSTAQHQVRDRYYNWTGNTHTNVWLWLGDNAYNDGTDNEYQTKVFDMYPTQFKKWVTWPTSGNHDLHAASSSSQTGPYYDNFTMPKAGEVGGLASGTEAYYSFNYANIHFVCLESTGSSFRSATGAMANWLKNDLAANTQRWTVVYFHHPPYSKGSHDSDAETQLIEMRNNIVPILETYKVDLVLAGHSHSYERSMFIRGHYGNEASFNASTHAVSSGSGIFPSSYIKTGPNYYGTVYVVCGTAGTVGATTTGWPHNAMYASSVSYYGSLVIDVNGDRLDSKFLTSTGVIWDQFTIEKRNSLSSMKLQADDEFNVAVPIASKLLVFPNPIIHDASVSYHLNRASKVYFDVLDLSGRIVYEFGDEYERKEGEHSMNFPISTAALPRGIYLLRMHSGEDINTARFVLE